MNTNSIAYSRNFFPAKAYKKCDPKNLPVLDGKPSIPFTYLSEQVGVSNVKFIYRNITLPVIQSVTDLKGLSGEMHLAFEDMHGQFQALIGDAASF